MCDTDGNVIENPTCQPSGDRLRYLESRIAEIEETYTCSICMERRRNVAFLCGHGACDSCSQTLRTCHMCRKIIARKINLYWTSQFFGGESDQQIYLNLKSIPPVFRPNRLHIIIVCRAHFDTLCQLISTFSFLWKRCYCFILFYFSVANRFPLACVWLDWVYIFFLFEIVWKICWWYGYCIVKLKNYSIM